MLGVCTMVNFEPALRRFDGRCTCTNARTIPPALAGTVGVMPALAGSAAAVAGLMQQLTGATGGYLVGLVPHEGAVNLGWMMLAFTLVAVAAQWALRQR